MRGQRRCHLPAVRYGRHYGQFRGAFFVSRNSRINADGQSSFDDAVLLKSYLLAVQTALPDWAAGDMDVNGRLNAADLTLLKRQLLPQDPDAE